MRPKAIHPQLLNGLESRDCLPAYHYVLSAEMNGIKEMNEVFVWLRGAQIVYRGRLYIENGELA